LEEKSKEPKMDCLDIEAAMVDGALAKRSKWWRLTQSQSWNEIMQTRKSCHWPLSLPLKLQTKTFLSMQSFVCGPPL
jgi:hypothetical protein